MSHSLSTGIGFFRPWAFFVASLRFASNSLVSNANLVTKIYFPRLIFPVSAVASQLFAQSSCWISVTDLPFSESIRL